MKNSTLFFMRKYIFVSLVIVLTLMASSCKKNDDEPEPTPSTPSTPAASMTATYDADTRTSTGATFNNELLAVNQFGNQYGIQGKHIVSGDTLTIYMVATFTGPGTYNLGAQSGNYAYFTEESVIPDQTYATTGTSPWVGTLTITAFSASSRTISGTFSYFGYNSSTSATAGVTSGSFSNVRF